MRFSPVVAESCRLGRPLRKLYPPAVGFDRKVPVGVPKPLDISIRSVGGGMRSTLRICCGVLLGAWIGTCASAQTVPAPDSKSPQYQTTGEQDRTYDFPGTGEKIAYHLYVPMKWTKGAHLPLVIVTHGASQPATAPFRR